MLSDSCRRRQLSDAVVLPRAAQPPQPHRRTAAAPPPPCALFARCAAVLPTRARLRRRICRAPYLRRAVVRSSGQAVVSPTRPDQSKLTNLALSSLSNFGTDLSSSDQSSDLLVSPVRRSTAAVCRRICRCPICCCIAVNICCSICCCCPTVLHLSPAVPTAVCRHLVSCRPTTTTSCQQLSAVSCQLIAAAAVLPYCARAIAPFADAAADICAVRAASICAAALLYCCCCFRCRICRAPLPYCLRACLCLTAVSCISSQQLNLLSTSCHHHQLLACCIAMRCAAICAAAPCCRRRRRLQFAFAVAAVRPLPLLPFAVHFTNRTARTCAVVPAPPAGFAAAAAVDQPATVFASS